jgi:hypothetical protein
MALDTLRHTQVHRHLLRVVCHVVGPSVCRGEEKEAPRCCLAKGSPALTDPQQVAGLQSLEKAPQYWAEVHMHHWPDPVNCAQAEDTGGLSISQLWLRVTESHT